MTEEKSNFWTTAIGIITGLTGLIAAISALLAGLGGLPFLGEAQNNIVEVEEVIEGKWISKDFYSKGSADFQFSLLAGQLVGKYNNTKQNAHIFDGVITHNIKNGYMFVNGYWSESNSKQACPFEKDNTKYWGKLELTFTSKKAMVGRWGYCNEPADNSFSAIRSM